MSARQAAMKKYIVTLSIEERERLEALIRTSKHSARKLLQTRILLKAECALGCFVVKRPSLAAEVAGVLFGEMGPFFRQIVCRKDGRNRARRNAGAAVDALDRIDEELIGIAVTVLILFGVDAVYWAGVHAGCIFGPDAGFRDYIRHLSCSPFVAPALRARRRAVEAAEIV